MLKALKLIKDFRRKQGQRYDLGTLLFLSIMAILSDANSYRKIEIFIRLRFDELKNNFNFTWEKAPSYSAIRNVIQGVSSQALEEAFRKDSFARLNDANHDEPLELSFDGKVVRGSFDHFKNVKAIQVLSIFCNKHKLILAHEEVGEKTNEIPVAQALIPKLPFENAAYTCDAMNCQTETISKIAESGNHFIVQVKGNQKSLLDDCILTASELKPIDTYEEPTEKGHGRITKRTARSFSTENIRNKEQKWGKISCIIEVQRDRQVYYTKEKVYKDTSEISYYISTQSLPAERFNSVIRSHWGIENSNHYVRDVSLKEDASRIRVNPQNMVKLKSFAMNILRSSGVTNIAARMYENSLSLSRLMSMNI